MFTRRALTVDIHIHPYLLFEQSPKHGKRNEDGEDVEDCFDVVDELRRVPVVGPVEPMPAPLVPGRAHLPFQSVKDAAAYV